MIQAPCLAWMFASTTVCVKPALVRRRNGKKDEVETFKAGAAKAVKELMPKFKDLQFYLGESMNGDGQIVAIDYREDADGNEKPYLLAFKHGLEAEKV